MSKTLYLLRTENVDLELVFYVKMKSPSPMRPQMGTRQECYNYFKTRNSKESNKIWERLWMVSGLVEIYNFVLVFLILPSAMDSPPKMNSKTIPLSSRGFWTDCWMVMTIVWDQGWEVSYTLTLFFRKLCYSIFISISLMVTKNVSILID